MRARRTSPDARRLGWSAAGALALHAGLAAFVLGRPSPEPSADRITVELREVEPRTPSFDPPPPPPRRERPPPRRPQVVEPARVEPPPLAEEIAQPPEFTDESSDIARTSQASLEASPGEPAPALDGSNDSDAPPPSGSATAGPPDAFHADALTRAMDHWRDVRGPGEDGDDDGPGTSHVGDGDSPERETRRVTQRIARDVRRQEAESRVEAGLVDPYFARVSRGADRRAKPTPAELGIKDGVEGYVRSLVESWGGAGKKWAQTGSPLRDPGSMLTIEKPRGAVVDGSALRGRLPDPTEYAWLWNTGQLATQLFVVEIELVQQPDGSPIAARILKPSGSRTFDEKARSALLASAEENDAPAHGLGLGGTRITSHWRVEAQPVPQVPSAIGDPANGGAIIGFGTASAFDEVLGERPAMPGEIRIIHRVTLLAVYGGERGRADAPDAGP